MSPLFTLSTGSLNTTHRPGIGRAIVEALAKYGAQVIALSRTEKDLEAIRNEVMEFT